MEWGGAVAAHEVKVEVGVVRDFVRLVADGAGEVEDLHIRVLHKRMIRAKVPENQRRMNWYAASVIGIGPACQ
jgi:hypothetical protein